MLKECPDDVASCPLDAAATPSDTLARAFLKGLAQLERERRKHEAMEDSTLAFIDGDDPVERLIAHGEPDRRVGHVPIPPGLALTAVLVARAVEADPDVLRRFRRENPVVVISTHMPELVDPVSKVIKHCALPTGAYVREMTGSKYQDLKHGQVGLVLRNGTSKEHTPEIGNSSIGSALHDGAALIGIAPDPKRQLPRDLMRSAEHQLLLPSVDHGAIALMIEAVTGERPTRQLDDTVLRTLDFGDLPVALRNVRSADEAIDAIARVLSQKADYLESGPSLEELHGYGAAREWGLTLARDLDEYRASRIGWDAVSNRGLLLSGPPGVGKTSYARALAKTARVPLVATSVAEWNSADYLSGTLQAIRNAFTRARAQAPCILFIDELDGISDRSKIRGEYVQYWTQIVNLVLELLAGVEERPGVVVVAATNHPDRIDAAVKRAGRLDREIAIEKPDLAALDCIFRHHLGPDPLVGVSLMPLALAARGKTGADVEAYVRRAKGVARRAGREIGIDDVLSEIRDDRAVLSGAPRWRTAIHEAGHVVAAWKLGVGTIVDMALHDDGGTLLLDHAVSGDSTLEELEALLVVLLAGRAAEALECRAASIGCGGSVNSDLARATTIAKDIELQFGLGVLGPVYVAPQASDLLLEKAVLGSVVTRLRAAEERAIALVGEQQSAVRRVASALEEAAYLSGAEIQAILAAAHVVTDDPKMSIARDGA